MLPNAFGKVLRRPIKGTKLIDLTDFPRPGLENKTAECLFPCRRNCWHPALCLSPCQGFWWWWRISSFKYTSDTQKKQSDWSQQETAWAKIEQRPKPRAWRMFKSLTANDFTVELGIQTPLRTRVIRICLFTLLYKWQQRWERLASLASRIILMKGCGGTHEKWRFSSGLKYIADTVADGTGWIEIELEVQGILKKVHVRLNKVTA